MTTRRYALRDDQWDRIKDMLPGKPGDVEVTAKDNRLFVEAVPVFPGETFPSALASSTLSTLALVLEFRQIILSERSLSVHRR